MDIIKWGTAGVLVAAFVGALLVRDNPTVSATEVSLPAICGDIHAAHDGGSMQPHIDAMAAEADEAHAALLQTMEPMHSDMMRGMTVEDFEVRLCVQCDSPPSGGDRAGSSAIWNRAMDHDDGAGDHRYPEAGDPRNAGLVGSQGIVRASAARLRDYWGCAGLAVAR